MPVIAPLARFNPTQTVELVSRLNWTYQDQMFYLLLGFILSCLFWVMIIKVSA
jgi:hypothetical protein